MGRTEERTFNKPIRFCEIPHIFDRAHFESLKMMHGVVAIAMTTLLNLFKQLWISTHIVTNKKKSSLDSVTIKQIQNPWSNFRDRTVIKGQIYNLTLFAAHAPYRLRKKEAIQQRRLLNKFRQYYRLIRPCL